MLRFLTILTIFSCTVAGSFAQVSYRTTPFESAPVRIFDPATAPPDFQPTVTHLEAPSPDGQGMSAYRARKQQEVRALYPLRPVQQTAKNTGDTLIQGRNFSTNLWALPDNPLVGGTPNDNTLAISDGNMLLTSWNSRVWGYDLDADTFLFAAPNKHPSFGLFSGINGLDFPFDPKLRYDPVYDRFVLTFLSGRTPSDSEIILCFSSSNNPSDPWYSYVITGNPHGDNTWTDYPAMALTEDELFLTVNLLRQGEPWQTGFDETVVWQIDKFSGYNGDSILGLQLWDSIYFDNAPIRYLHPVQGAMTPTGPNVYFLSNRNFAVNSDSMWLVEITDVIGQNAAMNVQLLQTDAPYSMPPEARQSIPTLTFQTNDGRVLGGFLNQNRIQFVANAVDPQSGQSAVLHGFIDDVNNPGTVTTHIIADPDRDFGYPNIAFVGFHPSQDHAVIGFNHSGPTSFAGNSAVLYKDGEYGPPQSLVEGISDVDRLPGNVERWGDYFGIQRKYNEDGAAWLAGYYGMGNELNSTWVSEVASTAFPVSVAENPATAPPSISAYPNPTADQVTIRFELAASQPVSFELHNLSGQLVRTFRHSRVKAGANQFTISTAPLPSGTYLLTVRTDQEALATQRITVAASR